METLTKPKRKGSKKKSFRLAPIKRKKLSEVWVNFNWEQIKAIMIEKERLRPIRVFINHVKKPELSGFLFDIITREKEKFLVVQRLGIRQVEKKNIEIKITKEISIQLCRRGEI